MPSAIASPTLFRNITSSGMPICHWYCFCYFHVFFHVNLLLFCFESVIVIVLRFKSSTDQSINNGEPLSICYQYSFCYFCVFLLGSFIQQSYCQCYPSLCLCPDQCISNGEHLTICWCYYHSYCYCYCFTDQCINDGEHLSVRSLRSDVSVANSRDDRDCEQQGIWKIPGNYMIILLHYCIIYILLYNMIIVNKF